MCIYMYICLYITHTHKITHSQKSSLSPLSNRPCTLLDTSLSIDSIPHLSPFLAMSSTIHTH